MSQEQKQPQPQNNEVEETEELPTESASDKEIDDILDEIDGVLEENAEVFVAQYVQRGGE